MPATGKGYVLELLHHSQAETRLMTKESSVPPANRDLDGNAPSNPFPWGFRRSLVQQASLGAVKPPLRPHPKPSNGTQGNQTEGQ